MLYFQIRLKIIVHGLTETDININTLIFRNNVKYSSYSAMKQTKWKIYLTISTI